MSELFDYTIRILPGVLLLVVAFVLTPAKSLIARIFLLILAFILVRDAMTPLGFWRFEASSVSRAVLWLRFTDNALLLGAFGITSLFLTLAVLRLNPELARLVRWGRIQSPATWALGVLGAAVIVVPVMAPHLFIPLQHRGGDFPREVLPALLVMALFGNLMEEVLFRGFLQGHYEALYGETRALLLSGVMFAAGHVFLASTVTNVGLPILLFTLYEGLICAWIRNRTGVFASTLSHGLAIFLLAAALV